MHTAHGADAGGDAAWPRGAQGPGRSESRDGECGRGAETGVCEDGSLADRRGGSLVDAAWRVVAAAGLGSLMVGTAVGAALVLL